MDGIHVLGIMTSILYNSPSYGITITNYARERYMRNYVERCLFCAPHIFVYAGGTSHQRQFGHCHNLPPLFAFRRPYHQYNNNDDDYGCVDSSLFLLRV